MPMAETRPDLADVFDSSDSPTEEVSVLSDLPSLRRQHATAGYRDGVAAAKGEHVQRGFDRGFPIGAELGIRVGVVLGVLEGLVKALSGGAATAAVADGEQSASLDSVKTLYEAAKKELAIERVFSLETKDRDAEKKAAEDVDEDDPCVRLGQVGDTAVTRRTSTKVSSQFLQELDQKIKDREFLPKTPLQRIDGRWAQMLPEKEVLTRRQSYLLRDPPQDAVEDGDDDAFEAQVLTRQARYRQGLCPISSRMPLPISRRSLASSSSRPPYETRASSNEARKRGEGWRNRLRGDTKE
ncbi:hypothetical protein McanCB49686_008105 [Microsporum canis]